jgi:hypothetical protein
MENNLIGLFNAEQYINADNVILAVNYDTALNESLLHNEYHLVQENKPDVILPPKIKNKLYDSLCGQDAYGNVVPQTGLTNVERYGIDIRPRQTMFRDRGTALETFFTYVNDVMAKNQIAETRNLTKLSEKEPLPTKAAGGWTESFNTYAELLFLDKDLFADGYKVLVLNDEQNNNGNWSLYELDVVDGSTRNWLQIDKQAYDTSDYWEYKDWYATDFTSSTTPDHTVENRNAVDALTIEEGDIIRVNNRGNGLFEILRVKSDLTTEVVGLEQGTISFLSKIWTDVRAGLWDEYNLYGLGSRLGNQEVNANVNNVWGTGYGDAGYGQTNVIVAKDEDNEPSIAEWTNMFNIITSIGNHQGTTIRSMNANDVELTLDNISNNVTDIHTNRLDAVATNVAKVKNIESTGTWFDQAKQIVRVTFTDADKVRYFFNAGGYITITPDIVNYTDDEKARSWDALTQMAGTIKFGATSSSVTGDSTSKTVTELHTSYAGVIASNIGYYDLNTTNTLIYSKTLTTSGSPYITTSPNNIKIYASSSGTVGATGDNGVIITFTIEYNDASTDNSDSTVYAMDGTVRTIFNHYEPSSTYLVKSWEIPTFTLYSSTHE